MESDDGLYRYPDPVTEEPPAVPAETLAKAPEEEPVVEDRPVSRLVFEVAGHRLLYDRQTPMEYFEAQALFRIPTSHPLFRGLVNRRGTLVPVYDVGVMLGAEASLSNRARVLVLGAGDDAVGVILDSTPHRESISISQKVPPPVQLVQVFGRHINDCFEAGSGYLVEVDLNGFLDELVDETN